jgi:hypothetical protein
MNRVLYGSANGETKAETIVIFARCDSFCCQQSNMWAWRIVSRDGLADQII